MEFSTQNSYFKTKKVGESLNEMINFVENFHLNMKYDFTIKFTSILPV